VACEYWDVAQQRFSTEGCAVVESASGYVACDCTHLTTFAAFQFPMPVQPAPDPVDPGSPISLPDASSSPIVIGTVALALLLQLGTLWLATHRHRRRMASVGGKAQRERAERRPARINERDQASRAGFASAVPATTPRLPEDGPAVVATTPRPPADRPAVAEARIDTGAPSSSFNQSRIGLRLAALQSASDASGAQARPTRLPAGIRADASRAVVPTLGSSFGMSPVRIRPKPEIKQTRLTAESLPPISFAPRILPDVGPSSLPAFDGAALAPQVRLAPIRKLRPTGAGPSNAVMSLSARSSNLSLHSMESADHLSDAPGQLRLGRQHATGAVMHHGASSISPPPSPPGEADGAHTQAEWRAAPTPSMELPSLEVPWRDAPIPNERIMAPPRRPRKQFAGAEGTAAPQPPATPVQLPPPASGHPPPPSQAVPVIMRGGSNMLAPAAAGTAPLDHPSPPTTHLQPSASRARVADSSSDIHPPAAASQPGLRARAAMATVPRSEVSFLQAWRTILRTEHTIMAAVAPLRGAAAGASYVLPDPQAVQVLWLQIHGAAAALALILATAGMSTATAIVEVAVHAAIVLGPCLIAGILFRLVFRRSRAGNKSEATPEVGTPVVTEGGDGAAAVAKRGRLALRTRLACSSCSVVLAWTLSVLFEAVCIAATLVYTLPFGAVQSGEYFAGVSGGLVLTWLVAEPVAALCLLGARAGLRRLAAH
jgi:hypothetical protein